MVVAPLAAVGMARGLIYLANRGKYGRFAALALASFFLAFCVKQSVSTFRTPEEWKALNEATRRLKELTQVEQMVVAPEAVLYYSDTRGDRLEFDPVAVRRAAIEWGSKESLPALDQPLGLTEFYLEKSDLGDISFPRALNGGRSIPYTQTYGGLLVADVGLTTNEPRRRAWREAIRHRPNTKILADEPGFMIAELR
jgi:hypothetical protein